MERQPSIRVFLSSTIRDFHDLRSALKYWLEDLGFDVLTSEFNDFDRRPDSGTFDSCFEAITTCNFFVILVGDRFGSRYEDGVSVTMREFQVARDLMQHGVITVLPFIRSTVEMASRIDDEDTIARLLWNIPQSKEVSELQRCEAERIRGFVKEIGATDVPPSVEGVGGKLWTYTFTDFEDIVKALEIALHANRRIRKQQLLAELVREVEENIVGLVNQNQGVPSPPTLPISVLRKSSILEGKKFDDIVILSRDQAQRFVMFDLLIGNVGKIRDDALRVAIDSGEFLCYDGTQRRFNDTPELLALRQLLGAIERCRRVVADLRGSTLSTPREDFLGQFMAGDESFNVPVYLVQFMFAIHDRILNVLRLLIAVSDWMRSGSVDALDVELLSGALTPEMEEEIQQETATREQVQTWLGYPTMRDMMTGLKTATDEDFSNALNAFPAFQERLAAASAGFIESFRHLMSEYRERLHTDGQQEAQNWLQEQVSKIAAS